MSDPDVETPPVSVHPALLLLSVCFTACASAPAPVASTSPREHPRAAAAPTSAPLPDPSAIVKEADAIHRDQLAVPGRDERFSADRQSIELERAIALYEQFIERAKDDPEYADAVRRSRERIEDARATLEFLKNETR